MPSINRWHSLNNLPFAGNCLMGISEQREIAKDRMDHGDHCPPASFARGHILLGVSST